MTAATSVISPVRDANRSTLVSDSSTSISERSPASFAAPKRWSVSCAINSTANRNEVPPGTGLQDKEEPGGHRGGTEPNDPLDFAVIRAAARRHLCGPDATADEVDRQADA